MRLKDHSARRSVVIAFVLFSVVAGAAAALLDPKWVAGSIAVPDPATLAPVGFLDILVRNAGAALLLYSGAATLGITGALGLFGVAAYVGATVRVGVDVAGWSALLGATGSYVFIEFAGIIVAGAAGLHPVLVAVTQQHRATAPRPVWVPYVSAIRSSLQLLGTALCLIVLAAAIEAVVISGR